MTKAVDFLDYRLLTFDDDGRFLPPLIEGHFRSDAEAINYARTQFPHLTVEIWCGRRLAATIDPGDVGLHEREDQSVFRSRWL